MAAVIPLLAVAVVIYALIKKVDVYDAFVKGATQGLPVLYRVLPYMAAMLICIRLLRESGAMDALTNLLSGPMQALGFPPELVPLSLLRPLSGSGTMALVADIFKNFGTDSLLGLMASTMMGSTETIFYTLALYFGSVGIQETRFTLPVALIATLLSTVGSVVVCNWLFLSP
ncbi:MAG TPA: nucleoside recognition domain-containing protein [Feifaniaceae bacterium]|nr:nucleoside recognition domain-containing protein [Feifaniaceae bacterium]